MSADPVGESLESVAHSLRRDLVARLATRWTALILAGLFVACLLDMLLRFGRTGRVALWGILVAALLLALRAVGSAWRQRPSGEATAARVEKACPELDNRLINYVQFAGEDAPDPFRRAYLDEDLPAWESNAVMRLRDRGAHRRGAAAAAVALGLLVLPMLWTPRAWSTAMRRVMNPFLSLAPATLTRIISVTPGDRVVPQAGSVKLACHVDGRRGHRVHVDLRPADDKPASRQLAILAGGEEDAFYNIDAISAPVQYRFRAGDAEPSPWHRISIRPPLAPASVSLAVTPPAYMGFQPRTFDALADEITIPDSSRLRIEARFNAVVTQVLVAAENAEPVVLSSENGDGPWSGDFTVGKGSALALTARNSDGEEARATVHYTRVEDELPVFEVEHPRKRVALPPEGAPRIQALVSDDYGIAELYLERTGQEGTEGEVVARWEPDNARSFGIDWRPDTPMPGKSGTLQFRLVAVDTCPSRGEPARSRSLVFERLAPEESSKLASDLDTRATGTLAALIDQQKVNLSLSMDLRERIDSEPVDSWRSAAKAQQAIRDLAARLLCNPLNPLGPLQQTVKGLYQAEMLEAAVALARVPDAGNNERLLLAGRAIKLEERILRQLTYANLAADRERSNRTANNLLGMLEALLAGQGSALADSEQCLSGGTRPGVDLIDRQDGLAGDLTRFVAICSEEAGLREKDNPEFSGRLDTVVKGCESRKLKASMLKAAEHLEVNSPVRAVPLQKRVVADLSEFMDLLNKWQLSQAGDRIEDLVEALQDTRERIEKLRKLQEEVLEVMRQLEPTRDAADRDEDLMEEELAELRKNTEESLLQIARDLHIFPELSVANDLVEDVFSVFEEVQQAAGSEEMGAEAAEEWGVLKPEALIEAMKKAEGQVEAMEHWLADKPDSLQYNNEPFDREETPKLALGGLESAVEDLIGDLLKESQEIADAAADSATNLAESQNKLPGWDVGEGPSENFGAQGESGNQTPDHKEQSGRSNVGREGQAIGETAAGTGTVSEGDPNIEERITPEPLQSGQVQADGDTEQRATGGGKQESGAADEAGMPGTGSTRRMDAEVAGDDRGLEALMGRAEALRIRTATMNLRTEAVGRAAHHLRQASDAVAAGLPIQHIRELEHMAVAALKEARTDLASGRVVVLEGQSGPADLQDATADETDHAPPRYRDLVAEYFRSLTVAPQVEENTHH